MNLRPKHLRFLFLLLFLLPVTSCQAPETEQTAEQPEDPPQNIILLIGDGMSYPQITATEYRHGTLRMTSMPHHGIISTYASNRRVTDSASGATALAAGYKTDNGMLGVLPDGTPVESIAHYANELGKRTALLASSRITHATPAAFAIHHESRGDEYIIAEKFVESGIDMILGAGSNYFLPEAEGGERPDDRNLISEMEEQGYLYIDDEADINRIVGSEKVVAFIEPGDLAPAPERGDQMVQLTRAALQELAQDPNGFFLMIEGSQIDWAGHDNNAEWMIEEMIDFDRVIGEVLDFAQNEGNTLVVVTADHETGGLTLPGDDEDIRYDFSTGSHTALHVPVFGFGPSADRFAGNYDNTDVAKKLFSIWGKEFEE